MKEYKNKNEERFNYPLINREYDDDLVEYIIDCCKSLEVLEYVKFIGYDYITNESEINTSEYIDAKSRTKLFDYLACDCHYPKYNADKDFFSE
jgi:hypothetical protein